MRGFWGITVLRLGFERFLKNSLEFSPTKFLRISPEYFSGNSWEFLRTWSPCNGFLGEFIKRIIARNSSELGFKKFLGPCYEKFLGIGFEKFLGIAVDIFTGFSCERFLKIFADFPQNCYLGTVNYYFNVVFIFHSNSGSLCINLFRVK